MWNPQQVIPWFQVPYSWNGDKKFEEIVAGLIKEHDLKWVFETGTSCGNTTRAMARMFEKVYTIEVNENQYNTITPHLKDFANVTAFLGDSGRDLGMLIESLNLDGKGMFYLDSHWFDDFPLLKELDAISKSSVNGKAVIVIDDIEIPGVVEGDKYGDVVLNLEYIEPHLKNTGVVSWQYHFPELPQYRGKLIALPSK
jgi:predicted O-methyltransferase YrrM